MKLTSLQFTAVMVNWQLSKQGFRWPVSPDRIEGSRKEFTEVTFFYLCLPLTCKVIDFHCIAGSSIFTKLIVTTSHIIEAPLLRLDYGGWTQFVCARSCWCEAAHAQRLQKQTWHRLSDNLFVLYPFHMWLFLSYNITRCCRFKSFVRIVH